MYAKKTWAVGVLLALGLAACAASRPPATTAEPMLAGGWQARGSDPEAKAAAAYAIGALNRPGAALRRLDAVQSQVVAGLNYKLTMTLSDGSRWQVVVYRDLQSKFSLTSSIQLP